MQINTQAFCYNSLNLNGYYPVSLKLIELWIILLTLIYIIHYYKNIKITKKKSLDIQVLGITQQDLIFFSFSAKILHLYFMS